LSDVLAHLTEFVGNQEKAQDPLALLYPALLAVVSLLMSPVDGLRGAGYREGVHVSRGAERLPDLGPTALSALCRAYVYVVIVLLSTWLEPLGWRCRTTVAGSFAKF
jgi:general secretion pathway protein F